MKLYQYLPLLIVGALFTSCSEPKSPFISGTSNNPGIYKVYLRDGNFKKLDSSLVVDNAFQFEREVTRNEVFEISAEISKDSEGSRRWVEGCYLFAEPNQNYVINIPDNKVRIKVSKKPLQAQYQIIAKKLDAITQETDNLYKNKKLSEEALNEAASKLFESSYSIKTEFIKTHPQSIISLFFVKGLNDMGSFQRFHDLENNLAYLDKNALKEYDSYQKLELEYKERLAKRFVGKQAPDFVLNTPEGEQVSLESLKGSYVLLDFWASWCAPCRVENKKVKVLYETLKDQGFKVVSISMDDKKELWEKAIKTDEIPWINLSDLKGFGKSEIQENYNVEVLPTTLLLDPKGIVLKETPTFEELTETLQEIYKI